MKLSDSAMQYYAINHTPGHPPALLQFDHETDRDAFVSRNPAERRESDPPDDQTGFRHAVADINSRRPLCCRVKGLDL